MNLIGSYDTVQARKLEYDCPPSPKPREEGQPAEFAAGRYSNFLESTVRPRNLQATFEVQARVAGWGSGIIPAEF